MVFGLRQVESELIKLQADLGKFYDSLVGQEMPRAEANVPGRLSG